MKKNIPFFSRFSLLIIIIYLIGAHPCFANTYKDEVNGVTYSYSVGSGEASVSFVPRGRENIHILASFQATDKVGDENKTFSYKVTSIPQNLFRFNTDLITVTGMENIKSIGYGAFYSCTSLTSVGDLSKLTSIGEFAFHFCSNLAGELNLENVSYIPRYTFTNCESLTKVGDLCMCTSIGEGAFSNCYSLTSVGDLSNCKSIGGHAFFYCSALADLGNLSNCTSIGEGAFEYCSSLRGELNLKNVLSISKSAFSDCKSLTNVGDLSNCKSIGKMAFSGCPSLAGELNLENLSIIEDGTFYNCSSLTSVGDLRNCESIGDYAFNGCSSLTGYLDLRKTKSIGQYAFCGAALKRVNMGGFEVDDVEATNATSQVRVRKERIVLSDPHYIKDFAFQNNKELEVYPEDLFSVRHMGINAFQNCEKLTIVKLPNYEKKLSDYAFHGCTALQLVELGNGCDTIGYATFKDCISLKKITYSDNLKAICQEAFFNNTNLKGSKTGKTVGVEQECGFLDLHKVDSIGPNAFENCTSLDSVFFGVIITGIKESIISVTNQKGEKRDVTEYTYDNYQPEPILRKIMGAAFRGCTSLKNVWLPSTLEVLGNQCFQNCERIKVAAFFSSKNNNKLIDIQNNTFNRCKSLEVFVHGGKIRNIQNEVFQDCSSLRIVNVTGIKGIIDKLAFGNCPFKNLYFGEDGTTAVGEVKAFRALANTEGKSDDEDDESFLIIGRHQLIAPDALKGTPWMENNQDELVYLCDNLIKYNKKKNNANIVVSEGTLTIGEKTFEGSDINSITLPSSITTIYNDAFYDCNSMKDIYCYATVPPVVNKAFNKYTATLHVPEGCSETYMQADAWMNFTKIVENWSEEHQSLLDRYDSLMILAKTGLDTIFKKEHREYIKDVSQLSSPYTETSEGSLAALLDGNTNTFWHSSWKSGSVAGGVHYLQVDMVDPIEDDIYICFTRRSTSNDHVTNMSVLGTNDFNAEKSACEELLTYDCPFKSETETIMSPSFKTNGYRYLRFYANATTTGRGFWHMSVFQLCSDIFVSDDLAEFLKMEITNLQGVINQQSTLNRKDISEEDYKALKEVYDVFKTKLAELTKSITITAKSYTREYGEPNPTFEYTSEGNDLDGEPEIICEATATSPVGEYPIIIKKGSVKNYNDSYVNGVLTITKAPLTVSVGNYTKKQGEANPEFVINYSGFKNDETEDVLKAKPIATSTATSSSEPGEYDIVVSGGEAENYSISYSNGKLIVEESLAVNISAKNFPDENFRNWILSQKYGTDGVLTEDEIAEVTSIHVNNNGGIQSLKGIEFFTALTELYVNNTPLTTLDVSKNIELILLECINNQLETLDVSNNTALRTLSCSYNQLTSLDVSKNTALECLYCDNNQLMALDISNNTKLTRLYCHNNHLTSLDVSKHTALELLYCLNNKLTKLDISNNTALLLLECGNNQLASLDVSKNTALTMLFCFDNQLTTLDVSNNTALTTLYCYNNQLTTLDVSQSTALTSLACYQNQIKDAGMDALVESLPTVVEGILYVISDKSEHNMMTTVQVAAAKAKGWIPAYYYDGSWYRYSGIDLENSIAINEENFPDGNFRNYLLGRYYGVDGVLTDKEISEIKYINVNNSGIQSLKGIEYFIALTTLYCYNNQLTALDVSKNTALTTLTCYKNQLTALDVSKNTELTGLTCYNNQLTTLDVSKNTALTYLTCDNNQLSALDVSLNTALTQLSCYNNQLTTLDVSKNTALTYLRCGINPLTTLDVSKNTALETLYCFNNQLTSLDLSKNIALKQLACYENQLIGLDVSQNTALERIYCYNNQLTTLDVSKNTALTYLSCGENPLTSLDVSQNMALTYLACNENKLTTLDVSQNTALTSLYCYNNPLTMLDLSQNIALTLLSCFGCQLNALDVSQNTALTSLYCYNNQLTSLDLSQNTALTTLYCYQNQINDVGMDALLESLQTVSEGVMKVIHYENEQNIMTTNQVEAAKAKGWIPYTCTDIDDEGNEVWKEYAGSEEDPDGIESHTSSHSNIEGDIYDINGRKLSAPQKGINIIRMSDGTTRKVMMK